MYTFIIKPLLILCIILFLGYRTLIKKKKDVISALLIIMVAFIGIDNPYKYGIFLNPFSLGFIIMLLYKAYIDLYVKLRNKFYENTVDANIDFTRVSREMDVDYNPSIVGYLLKQRLEMQDLSADIMNLFANKFIDIKKFGNKDYEIVLNQEDYTNIAHESDRYILNTLTNRADNFNFKEWERFVKGEYRTNGFSNLKEYISGSKILINMALIIFIGTVLSTISLKLLFPTLSEDTYMFVVFGVMLSTMLAIIYCLIISAKLGSTQDKDIYLSEKGKSEVRKWLSFKKFMKEYTLIGERMVEEIVLYEKYIPYAVAVRCE